MINKAICCQCVLWLKSKIAKISTLKVKRIAKSLKFDSVNNSSLKVFQYFFEILQYFQQKISKNADKSVQLVGGTEHCRDHTHHMPHPPSHTHLHTPTHMPTPAATTPTFNPLLLQAHLRRLAYPLSVFLLLGWYSDRWWEGDEEDQKFLARKYEGCSVADREAVLNHALAPRKAGRTFAAADARNKSDSGIVSY